MSEITKEDIKNALTEIGARFDEELFANDAAGLERYWHFKFNHDQTLVNNLYEFHEKLNLYGRFCRRWEEHHNGSCCVVERVRDKYLLPKIRTFVNELKKEDTPAYKSVTELCSEHPNLAEYVRQMEKELAFLRPLCSPVTENSSEDAFYRQIENGW